MSSLSAQLDTRPRCSQEQLGKFAVWRNDRETMRSQVFQELRQLSKGPSLPSPTRLATAYYALRLCQPKAGFPIIQMGYDDLFTVIDKKRESKAATDTRAYLHIALYIATKKSEYREMARDYVRKYDPKSQCLRQFVSTATKREARKFFGQF